MRAVHRSAMQGQGKTPSTFLAPVRGQSRVTTAREGPRQTTILCDCRGRLTASRNACLKFPIRACDRVAASRFAFQTPSMCNSETAFIPST